jgi:hypothetical protein
MNPVTSAASTLQDQAALWSAREIDSGDLVEAEVIAEARRIAHRPHVPVHADPVGPVGPVGPVEPAALPESPA